MDHVSMKTTTAQGILPQVDDPELWDQAIYNITGKLEYFNTYWRQYLPGKIGDVILAMWRITRHDKKRHIKREDFVARYQKIAENAHVARSTVGRVLQRNRESGHFLLTYYNRPVGPYIERWVRMVVQRWYVNQETHETRQACNYYEVQAIMPPIPEHDELVRTEYARLVSERDERAKEAAQEGIYKNRTQVAVRYADSSSSPKIGHHINTEANTEATGYIRSLERELGPVAISNADREQDEGRSAKQGDRSGSEIQRRNTAPQSNQIKPSTNLAAPGAPPARNAPRMPDCEEDRQARDYALWLARDKFAQNGASAPDTSAKSLILEMEALEAPYQLLARLVRHGITKSMKDGRNVKSWSAHIYRTTMNLAKEAARRGWDLDAIEAHDAKRWHTKSPPAPAATVSEGGPRLDRVKAVRSRAGMSGSSYQDTQFGR